jgi:hypothetical protein
MDTIQIDIQELISNLRNNPINSVLNIEDFIINDKDDINIKEELIENKKKLIDNKKELIEKDKPKEMEIIINNKKKKEKAELVGLDKELIYFDEMLSITFMISKKEIYKKMIDYVNNKDNITILKKISKKRKISSYKEICLKVYNLLNEVSIKKKTFEEILYDNEFIYDIICITLKTHLCMIEYNKDIKQYKLLLYKNYVNLDINCEDYKTIIFYRNGGKCKLIKICLQEEIDYHIKEIQNNKDIKILPKLSSTEISKLKVVQLKEYYNLLEDIVDNKPLGKMLKQDYIIALSLLLL